MEDCATKIKTVKPITPTKKIKIVELITPVKNIAFIPIKFVFASITIPVKSVFYRSLIESVSVENSFP